MGGSRKRTRKDRHENFTDKSRPRKRKQYFNPSTAETNKASFSSSEKKVQQCNEIIVPKNSTTGYRFINFITVFTTLSTLVKCSKKGCNEKIKFEECQTRGIGFKIAVQCEKCNPQYIHSSPLLGHSYEINRRFIYVMRLFGLGYAGCKKFCGLMDMGDFFGCHTSYDAVMENIRSCANTVTEKYLLFAADEEKKQQNSSDLHVSGDGTWKKRGFTSLYGVTSLIGLYTGKVLDLVVKSGYCKKCEYWESNLNSAEFQEWFENHENECAANHEGSSGKMEVDSIIEMFKRSVKKYKVRYLNYIGDSDSKTYSGIIKAAPYGDDVLIKKKECVGHVQKRMGIRLRNLVNTVVEVTKTKGKVVKKKILSGKNKLTGKMIDKLAVYYELAIRRNCDSIEKMKNAIWATYYHYASTDEDPQHEKCPSGEDSWCSWQQASATDSLASYKHDYKALPSIVLETIKPIYEELSSDVLLERCVGGFSQNSNESFNQLVWKITPKHLQAGFSVVEVAANIAACTFNDGTTAHLSILHSMGVNIGHSAHEYARKEDESRILHAERKSLESSKEGRTARRQEKKDCLDSTTVSEDAHYGPGIDDSM
ncbi:hypothetical protein ALC57_18735 [Trachymyrmex cornetzi]|uniref:Mutator-like transposase domain-containing protein n=1 Tax=Trachymyrmex cornetzi TaxID=471704 RepID=A0A151IR53_9HYME|nr:hypothetical protein ALC57_18735 [Trachymyrmex cornetzi]